MCEMLMDISVLEDETSRQSRNVRHQLLSEATPRPRRRGNSK